MKNLFLTGLHLCLLLSFSCSNKTYQEEIHNKDSTSSGKSKDSTTVDNLEEESMDDFTNMYWDIVNTIKRNGDLSELNKYIHPDYGTYLLFDVGDQGASYQKYEHLEDLNGDNANGPGPDAYIDFQEKLSKTDTALLKIKYDLTYADECDIKEKGTHGILIQQQIAFLSNLYNDNIQITGEKINQDELSNLSSAESIATEKIIMNCFDNSTANGAEVFYLSLDNDKWYLLGIDLRGCGGK